FWGAFNLEEAWVRYRASKEFNLKVGLQIPEFNHLNEINNRTPLLPYIVRPLVYETSLNEIIAVEEYVPARAFVQTYGFVPTGQTKIDYAVYVGNSPNVANRRTGQLNGVPHQTGVDTTATFLVGGRLGVRLGELKVGVSGTYDRASFPTEFADTLGVPVKTTQERPRTRFGADISHRVGRFTIESEYIKVNYHVDIPQLGLQREFYYGTLGYDLTERLFAYVSYWNTRDILVAKSGATDFGENVEVEVPTAGAFYRVNDRISVKAQYAYVRVGINIPEVSSNFNHFGMAVSVFF
ncbi:MAG: hypothetical protein OEN01_11525, partial [Candidatus Krumholzibacteria bacterium]|nr:hypothetical protein [Candidatus Krumholzibacteria bacterium]